MRGRLAALAWLAAALSSVAASAAPTVISNVGFDGSECARYDAAGDRILVSNLGPRDAGNDGFISLLSPDGKVTELKWIEGGRNGVTLINPLGLFVARGTLYVADITAVRLFDLASGAPRGSIEIAGAIRLNDLTVAPDGTIYVTDSAGEGKAGAVYRISPRRKVTLFAPRDDSSERPNGVAIMADGSVVHGGRGVNLVFRDKSGRISRERSLPLGRVDGIVPLPDGGLLVAAQDAHAVYRLPPAGPAVPVASDIPIPAAIGLDTRRNHLLIPQIAANSLTIVELTP